MNTALLKSKRVAKGLSQVQLAELVKVSPTTYNQCENGKVPFRMDIVKSLILLLKLSESEVSEIFFDS